MEYSLHKSLKEVYCDEGAQLEVVFGDYRIDVVDGSGPVSYTHLTLPTKA